MIRSPSLPPLLRLPVRLAALGTACAITTLIVLAHTADLATLGGHDVVATASVRTVVAAAATETPHVDASH